MLNKNLFELFPTEVIFLIIGSLDILSFIRLSKTCRAGYQIVNGYPWQEKLHTSYGIDNRDIKNSKLSVQAVFGFYKFHSQPKLFLDDLSSIKSQFSTLIEKNEDWAGIYQILLCDGSLNNLAEYRQACIGLKNFLENCKKNKYIFSNEFLSVATKSLEKFIKLSKIFRKKYFF